VNLSILKIPSKQFHFLAVFRIDLMRVAESATLVDTNNVWKANAMMHFTTLKRSVRGIRNWIKINFYVINGNQN
jgi:hypothetical protein